MEHKFRPSMTDSKVCSECKQTPMQHGDFATCETCPNIGPVEMFAGMAMCASCREKELEAVRAHQAPELQEARLAEHNRKLEEDKLIRAENTPILSISDLVTKARSVDQSLQVVGDLFNAATVAIVDIKNSIESDDSIPTNEKAFRLANVLIERNDTYAGLIFDTRKTLVELESTQRTIQTYLNDLANKLRKEEREKLSLKYADYKPNPVKPAPTGTRKPKTPKYDKDELAKAVAETGMPAHVIQMGCVRMNQSIEQWLNAFRKTMKESDSEFGHNQPTEEVK